MEIVHTMCVWEVKNIWVEGPKSEWMYRRKKGGRGEGRKENGLLLTQTGE